MCVCIYTRKVLWTVTMLCQNILEHNYDDKKL